MKPIITITFLLILLSSFQFLNGKLPSNSPKYFELESTWDKLHYQELKFYFDNPDSNIEHEMNLVFSKDSLPLFYYADILTPVCIDKICKPLYIELYWDLLGNYIGYGEYDDELLSKYDHETFNSEDYLKLHKLLSNPRSRIERKKISDLYDADKKREKSIQFKGKEVDGITGATKLEIKQSVVEGALFSCFTLYHLVHGSAQNKMKETTALIYNEEVAEEFLTSKNKYYQEYAIKNLPLNKFEGEIFSIVSIFKTANPLNRSIILKKLPKSLFSHSIMTETVYHELEKWDHNSRTLLIKNVEYADYTAFIYVSKKMEHLTKNQVSGYLKHLNLQKPENHDIVMKNLQVFSEDSTYPYEYLVKEYLDRN